MDRGEIAGPPEVRNADLHAAYLSPWRRDRALPRFRFPPHEAC
jgi:hypothetical protein